ncbi:MAG: DUF4126 domain-containing protein [Candidatus Eisenbacteria bacterium]
MTGPLDSRTTMELLLAAMAGISIAAACGLRAFLPILALAGGARLGWVHLSPSMAWLSGDAVIWALSAATVIELLADKVPALDHMLDLVSTFIRPVAAAFAAWAGIAGLNPVLGMSAALIMGAGALGVHALKAKTRVGSSALTLGAANPILSFIEDAITATMSAIALLAPILGAILVLLAIYLCWRAYFLTRSAVPAGPSMSSPPAAGSGPGSGSQHSSKDRRT